ncbi:phosphoglycerate dehydrogenase [Paraclostridium ghonii]|uniref:Phosphoglycerate dehydrogenase-like enzyme n=1 Tax=Paraclostridium ghonii TaxID=29358 RepID=A0ABU0N342_9FIRM|nr:phosphoglycerate dehydrogenase [Paeniclostridium ghonii]MDQ0557577.1 phosphoglycerate dehydrogenase-like enzyme [Paeniclostridium ghonii]
MKLLVTNKYRDDEIEKLEDLGYEVIYMKESNAILNDEIKDTEVLVGYNPFKTLDISKLANLKLIQLSSVGIDQIPKDIVIKNNILVCNNKGNYSIPMAEYIVMYILNVYKNTKQMYENQSKNKWELNTHLEELTYKKILFIGTGTIAKNAADRLKPFGAYIYGINTDGRDIEGFDKCISIDNIDSELKECDVVVLTLPSTKETVGMIDDEKLKNMKNGSVIINVGRGNIINEHDLINNISKFKGVCLDVFEHEPLNKESKLWDFENVTITPHNSWISNQNRHRTFKTIHENLNNYINKKRLKNIVDIQKGY